MEDEREEVVLVGGIRDGETMSLKPSQRTLLAMRPVCEHVTKSQVYIDAYELDDGDFLVKLPVSDAGGFLYARERDTEGRRILRPQRNDLGAETVLYKES